MSRSSLRDGYRAVVLGASGGIGAAVVNVLTGNPRCAHGYAGARLPLEVADVMLIAPQRPRSTH
jgi:NAD(P)-dependent dehydrogenase (short-subunit alcohol dehydrogenase family)